MGAVIESQSATFNHGSDPTSLFQCCSPIRARPYQRSQSYTCDEGYSRGHLRCLG